MENVNVPPEKDCIKVLDGQGWIALLDHMGSEIDICNAARVSFGKFKTEMEEGDVKLLKYLIEHQHTSTLEHVIFKFSVYCPLFVRSQWHRHRTWSFNEISRRYTDENIAFFVPQKLREQAKSNRQASVEAVNIDQYYNIELINKTNIHSCLVYEELLKNGVCREQARGVLPQNSMTTYIATVDLNNLIKFLILRDSEHAQSEIVEYAKAIKALIRPYVPHVFGIVNSL